MPVGELARRVTVHEFVDWQRFAEVHPFPAEIVDHHGAMVSMIMANAHRDPKSTPTPFPLREFLLLHGPEGRPTQPKSNMTEAERVRMALGR